LVRDIEIIGIFGRNNELGEGKTLLLTFFALDNYEKYKDKSISFADYTLPFAKPINHVSEFSEIGEEFRGKIIFVYLDDVIPFFDSRHSGANIRETWVLTQCRKYGINLFYTGQLKGAIDGRLRLISNEIIETEKLYFLNKKEHKFKLYSYDKHINKIKEPIEITYGSEILDMYKTLEIVKRQIKLDELQEYFKSYNKKVSFRVITKAMYSFKYNIADTIFECLKHNDIKSIKKVLLPFGYELV